MIKIPLIRKTFVCEACGKPCFLTISNDHNSLPNPICCPYNNDDDEFVCEWKEIQEVDIHIK